MNEYETIAEIRQREARQKHVPIITMTAHVVKKEQDKCLATGMDNSLSKTALVAHLDKPLVHWHSFVKLPATTARAAEQPGETQDSSPVDMEICFKMAGNEKRIPALARRYAEQAHEHLETLQEAIAVGIAANVKGVAHKAMGSSAMCGMNSMVVLLRELERMGHEHQLGALQRVFARVEQEFARIKAFFARNLETTNTPAVLAGIKETKS